MIAITGANGQLGQLVIQQLLNRTTADQIIALVRSPEQAGNLRAQGVEVREADYDRPETLTNALQGVNKLLLISGNQVGQRVAQHQAVIDAAKTAGVELLVYTSILKADQSPLGLAEEHKITEAAIAASGLANVILRNGWYTENYTQNIAAVLAHNAVVGSADEGKLHTAARVDYAEAAAIVLTDAQSHAGNIYELAGDQGFTLQEYANAIAAKTEKEIHYQPLSAADFTALLTGAGLPEGFAALIADSEVQAAKGWLADDSQTLSRLIGRPTTALTTSLEEVL